MCVVNKLVLYMKKKSEQQQCEIEYDSFALSFLCTFQKDNQLYHHKIFIVYFFIMEKKFSNTNYDYNIHVLFFGYLLWWFKIQDFLDKRIVIIIICGKRKWVFFGNKQITYLYNVYITTLVLVSQTKIYQYLPKILLSICNKKFFNDVYFFSVKKRRNFLATLTSS